MKKTAAICLVGLMIFPTLRDTAAFGAGGELKSPQVAIPRSLAEVDREAIRAVLLSENCTFVAGSWLNNSTQLHYKSRTVALGHFLDSLSKCSRVKVWIGFYHPGPSATWAPADSNWSVFHSATDNSFAVKIRLGSAIDLTKLRVPPLKAESK